MSWATALVAALLCGAAGCLVPALVGRLPGPEYAAVAARPGLARTSALVSALAGGLAGLVVGWAWVLPAVLLVVPVGVALSVVDLHTRLLPKALVLPLTGAVAVLLLLAAGLERDPAALVRAAVGLAAARTLYWLLWRVRSSGMGFGDVRLAFVLGLFLGWIGLSHVVTGMFLGVVLISVVGVLLALLRLKSLQEHIAFGPFLAVGSTLAVFAGGPIIRWWSGG